jgi:O-methyltransferase
MVVRIKEAMRRELLRLVGAHSGILSGILSERARLMELVFEYAFNESVQGDYAEFGVFEGSTTAAAWHASRRLGMKQIRFHAFDSFQGLPSIGSDDATGGFRKGDFAAARATFERNLRRYGVDLSRVTVTEGMFDDTLTPARREQLQLDKVALAFIDCDLYASTVPVLSFLTDLLVDGSVLMFDDWFCFKGRPDRGEQRAFAEWREANPHLRLVEYQTFHWSGMSFLVHRDE